MLALKAYQRRALDELDSFLRLAATKPAAEAFTLLTGRPYMPALELPELPYVCLRLPTGGGKTLLAAHAVGLAAQHYLHAGRALVLWLAPSNAIVEQTLAALRERRHPYRQALEAAFPGAVEVMDLKEALYLSRAAAEGATCVIVAFRRARSADMRAAGTSRSGQPAGLLALQCAAAAPPHRDR